MFSGNGNREVLLQSRILIVDDDSVVLDMLRRILRREGFAQVVATVDPFRAAELYQEFRPDAVILDLTMPGMNGFEVMERIKKVEPEGWVPVLVLTGEHDPEVRIRALTSGARDFLAKPFTPVEALARIRNLLEIHLLYRRTTDHNRQLEEEVRARTHQLEEAHLEMVRRLGMAAEYRDDDTGNHIHRISGYAAVLGRRWGLPLAEVDLLRHAAAMHDIGKIGIPDSVLLKPGKLTPEEWTVMKSHAEIGANLLSNGTHALLKMAEEVARTHHERWDGTGYPNGKTGEDIPIVGRLVAVCDVFDALTSERPYKKAWPVEEAVAEIEKQAGRQFDPRVVALFLEALPELLQIRETYSSTGETPWRAQVATAG